MGLVGYACWLGAKVRESRPKTCVPRASVNWPTLAWLASNACYSRSPLLPCRTPATDLRSAPPCRILDCPSVGRRAFVAGAVVELEGTSR